MLLSDDGEKFRQAKLVPVRSTLTAVSFADDKNGWAGGLRGVIIATVDGGETWQLQRSIRRLTSPSSRSISRTKPCWAVELWSLMLATKDGGKTWAAVQLPVQQGAEMPAATSSKSSQATRSVVCCG